MQLRTRSVASSAATRKGGIGDKCISTPIKLPAQTKTEGLFDTAIHSDSCRTGPKLPGAAERRLPLLSLPNLVSQFFNGLALGALLALISSGLTIIYGTLGVLNLAHGAMFMVGGYAGWVVWNAHRLLPAGRASVAPASSASWAWLMEFIVIRHGSTAARRRTRSWSHSASVSCSSSWCIQADLRQPVRLGPARQPGQPG